MKNEKMAPTKDVASVESETENVTYVTIAVPVALRPAGHPSDRCDVAAYRMRRHKLVTAFHRVREGFREVKEKTEDGYPVESNSDMAIRIMELVAIELRKNGISV